MSRRFKTRNFKKSLMENSVRSLLRLPLTDSDPCLFEDICVQEFYDLDPIEEIHNSLDRENLNDYSDDLRIYIR